MEQDPSDRGHTVGKGKARLVELPEAQQMLRNLSAALANHNVYPPGHEIVTASLKALWESLAHILRRRGETSVERIEDEFSFEGLPITGLGDQARLLAEKLGRLGLEIILFKRGLDASEVAGLVALLGDAIRSPDRKHDWDSELRLRGVDHVCLGRLATVAPRLPSEGREGRRSEVCTSAVGVVRGLMEDGRRGRTLDLRATQATVVRLVERMLRQKDSTLALAMMKTYDEYLFVHSVNVMILTLGIAETFTADEELLVALGKAAMVHDIGKTAVPAEILNKPGALTDEEWGIMRLHPEFGMRMIESSYGKFNLASVVAFEHHLHYDGGGYPSPRYRHEKTPYSMMVSIADCYDALTTRRSYRKEMTPEAALNLMAENSGTHFEPRLLRSFLLTMGIYPVGSLVKLTTGETCVIRQRNPQDVARPRVVMLLDPGGRKMDGIEVLDLAERNPFTGEHLRSIKQAVSYSDVPDIDLANYLG